jgi:hypothetical protein
MDGLTVALGMIGGLIAVGALLRLMQIRCRHYVRRPAIAEVAGH